MRLWRTRQEGRLNPARIAFFGHFGRGNFGNDSTFRAVLLSLRRVAKDAEFICICTGAETLAVTYNIATVPTIQSIVKPWKLQNRVARFARKLVVGMPSELVRWSKAFKTLWSTDALLIPGTGLLTDAYGLFGWGPYDLFKWSLTAKLCRCKVFFVSVGAGPLDTRAGRLFVKAALSLADFRSYRDDSSRQYLSDIGFNAHNDPVYPDLAFSLPETVTQRPQDGTRCRLVVGLGLIEYGGTYGAQRPAITEYAGYLENLASFVKWLLAHDYDVRLLIGDVADVPTMRQFKASLKEQLTTYDEGRIIDEPVASVEDLLSQLEATDFVLATRFHNVLLSLLLNKPVIAISFHHKCSSLMSQMGLSEYCQDINNLKAEMLIRQFCQLQTSADHVKRMVREKVESCREALEEQYSAIFSKMRLGRNRVAPTSASFQRHPNTNVLS